MEPLIRPAHAGDCDAWARLRHALWPEEDLPAHRAEVAEALAAPASEALNLVALVGSVLVGFAETRLRHDYVNGCHTSPVVFLEGIYVDPAYRAAGVARALCAAVELWGTGLGCAEFASDALLENTTSHAFHVAVGFEETERVVYFRKAITPSPFG